MQPAAAEAIHRTPRTVDNPRIYVDNRVQVFVEEPFCEELPAMPACRTAAAARPAEASPHALPAVITAAAAALLYCYNILQGYYTYITPIYYTDIGYCYHVTPREMLLSCSDTYTMLSQTPRARDSACMMIFNPAARAGMDKARTPHQDRVRLWNRRRQDRRSSRRPRRNSVKKVEN